MLNIFREKKKIEVNTYLNEKILTLQCFFLNVRIQSQRIKIREFYCWKFRDGAILLWHLRGSIGARGLRQSYPTWSRRLRQKSRRGQANPALALQHQSGTIVESIQWRIYKPAARANLCVIHGTYVANNLLWDMRKN